MPLILHRRLVRALLLASLPWLQSCAVDGGALATLGADVGAGVGAGVTQAVAARGVREILGTGAGRALQRLAAVGGYANDPLLRLHLPTAMEAGTVALRAAGLGAELEAVETGMNLAAAAMAGEALPVLLDTIGATEVRDAAMILEGGDRAATDWLKARAGAALRSKLAPIVVTQLVGFGVYAPWKAVQTTWNSLPGQTAPLPNLEEHVTDMAMAGLWRALGDEEQRIRTDPAARDSALLDSLLGAATP